MSMWLIPGGKAAVYAACRDQDVDITVDHVAFAA
jgi:hypothetical protein